MIRGNRDIPTLRKVGFIHAVKPRFPWMYSHTAPLTALVIDEKIRVYFGTRSKPDVYGRRVTQTTFLDLDVNDPTRIIRSPENPIIPLGKYGCFDEFGIGACDVVQADGIIYLYYAGWQRLSGTAGYQTAVGCAVSHDGGESFEKAFEGPVLGIDRFDPISVGNLAVLKVGDEWLAYYTSLTEWIVKREVATYRYQIRLARSTDGLIWVKDSQPTIEPDQGEGVATPTVLKEGNELHMWYGVRPAFEKDGSVGHYRIGYASSMDGRDWQKHGKVKNLGSSVWDSEMQCYPKALKVGNRQFLFYAGNDFGYDGFGVVEITNE